MGPAVELRCPASFTGVACFLSQALSSGTPTSWSNSSSLYRVREVRECASGSSGSMAPGRGEFTAGSRGCSLELILGVALDGSLPGGSAHRSGHIRGINLPPPQKKHQSGLLLQASSDSLPVEKVSISVVLAPPVVYGEQEGLEGHVPPHKAVLVSFILVSHWRGGVGRGVISNHCEILYPPPNSRILH